MSNVRSTASGSLPGPRGLDNVRALRQILRDPAATLDALCAQYGAVCGLGFGPARMAVIGAPASLAELFAMPTDDFKWGHKFNVLGFVVGEGSMIVSDGDDHLRRRASVKGAFSRRRLNGWIPMIIEQTDACVERTLRDVGPDGRVIDLAPVARRLLLEIVVRAFFGERLAARAEEIGSLFQSSQDYLESPALRQLPHPLPGTRRARVRSDLAELERIITTEIAACRARPSGDPLDVLEALVQEGSLTDSEIRDQVITLLGAGYDTTSASLSWMLWCASNADGVWDALRTEADQLLGDPTDGCGAADPTLLSRLTTADRVMRETLRLHPAGVLSPREATRDMTVGGFPIRRGTLILWSAHLAGRSAAAWDEPLRFDPDRFLDLTAEQEALTRTSWVPFGGGARNCIGFMLAQMELTLMISRLAQRLDVTSLGGPAPKPVGMVVNRPTGGVHLRVSARARIPRGR